MNTQSKKRGRSSGVIEDPSTLVYTLVNPAVITFDEFSLVVRSLHSYMVEDITSYRDSNTVHVKLGFQASVANATKKLGTLESAIAITKLSTYVTDKELPLLDTLKRRFGFGVLNDEPEPAVPQAPVQPRTFQRTKYRVVPSTSAPVQSPEHM